MIDIYLIININITDNINMLGLQQNIIDNRYILNLLPSLHNLQRNNNLINGKTLYIDDNKTMPVIATGILIYKNVCGNMKLLMIDVDNRYEDIGRKIENQDKTIYDTVCRGIEEETNGIIKRDDIYDRLHKSQYIYNPKSKYVIHILEASITEKKLQKNDFGDKEIYNQRNRIIGWIDRKKIANRNIFKFKLNNRIQNKILFNTLLSIEIQFKFKKKLF